jgi:hypothetical protein
VSPLQEELKRRADALRNGLALNANPWIVSAVREHADRIDLADARHRELMDILQDVVTEIMQDEAPPAGPPRRHLRVVRDSETG